MVFFSQLLKWCLKIALFSANFREFSIEIEKKIIKFENPREKISTTREVVVMMDVKTLINLPAETVIYKFLFVCFNSNFSEIHFFYQIQLQFVFLFFNTNWIYKVLRLIF